MQTGRLGSGDTCRYTCQAHQKTFVVSISCEWPVLGLLCAIVADTRMRTPQKAVTKQHIRGNSPLAFSPTKTDLEQTKIWDWLHEYVPRYLGALEGTRYSCLVGNMLQVVTLFRRAEEENSMMGRHS